MVPAKLHRLFFCGSGLAREQLPTAQPTPAWLDTRPGRTVCVQGRTQTSARDGGMRVRAGRVASRSATPIYQRRAA